MQHYNKQDQFAILVKKIDEQSNIIIFKEQVIIIKIILSACHLMKHHLSLATFFPTLLRKMFSFISNNFIYYIRFLFVFEFFLLFIFFVHRFRCYKRFSVINYLFKLIHRVYSKLVVDLVQNDQNQQPI